MSLKFLDPPCKLDEVIHFNFSIENLQKFLQFLILSDREVVEKLNEHSEKMVEMGHVKNDLDKLDNKILSCQENISQIDNTLDKTVDSFNFKFISIDDNLSKSFKRMTEIEDKDRTLTMRSKLHDEQIENLVRNFDESFRNISKLGEVNEKVRHSQQIFQEKLDKIDRNVIKLTSELERLTKVEKNFESLKEKISQYEKDNEDFQYNVNKKFTEAETNTISLVSTVAELAKKFSVPIVKTTIINNDNTTNNNNNNSNTPIINEINPIQYMPQMQQQTNNGNQDGIAKNLKEIEGLKKLLRDFSEKLEKITNSNMANENSLMNVNTKFELLDNSLKKSINEISEEFRKFTEKKEEDPNKVTPEQQIELLFDQIEKIQDAVKSTTLMLHSKATKDEADKISRMIKVETEKLSNKIIEATKITDNRSNQLNDSIQEVNKKIKKMDDVSKEKNKSSINMDKLNENMTSALESFFNQNLKNKINNLFESEELILPSNKNDLKKISDNKNEIENILKIIEELKKEMNKENELIKLESKVALLNRKIFELDEVGAKNKKIFEEKFKSIEGDMIFMEDPEVQSEKYPDWKVFDAIKYLFETSANEGKRVDSIKYNQDNMNTQILTKVKKDLSLESGKVLEEFRNDLKISIGKIELKLREKVDLLSLDEFGRRVDNKLNNEINKKLDKHDLKKNNNMINKKIDVLENKISKTLVDTLIDLQMDDAPLIVKKSTNNKNGEKCASCNQFRNQGSEKSPEHFNDCSSHNNSINNNNKNYKFRNIQDNSNKYGTGSYSRHLLNIDGDDLRQKSFQLPDISGRGGPNTTIRGSMAKTFSRIKIDDFTEKRFNSMIEEELEKNIVNPDNLIKNANKFHDSVEKRFNNSNSLRDY